MVLTGVAAVVFQVGPSSLRAQSDASTALAGQITSAEEGPMEGVLVTAKKAGSTVAVTVASDERGRYRFPRTRLEPGRYAIRIRAIGYEVDDPGPVEVVEIPASKAQQLDLKLHKIQDVTTQLTDGEWITSWPGTAAQKRRATPTSTRPTPTMQSAAAYSAMRMMSEVETLLTSSPTRAAYASTWSPMRCGSVAASRSRGWIMDAAPVLRLLLSRASGRAC